MLSRAALVNLERPAALMMIRSSASSASTAERLKRQEYSNPVRMGFIPESWFQFFYPKTGVTGPYTFGAGLLTYLFSKEIYVCEHEFYAGLSLAIMCIYATKKFGPSIAAALDKDIANYATEMNEGRETTKRELEDAIKNEKTEQWRAEGQALLVEAKRENALMQLEAAYRERLARAYSEVKRRLDYQVERLNVERRVSQRHQVNWIVSNVLKSITPDQEKATLNQCISDLNALAARSK